MLINKIGLVSFNTLSTVPKDTKKDFSFGTDLSLPKKSAYPGIYYMNNISFGTVKKSKRTAVIALAMFQALAQCKNIQDVKEKFKNNINLKNVKDEKTLKNEFKDYKFKYENGTLTEQDKKSDLSKVYGFLNRINEGKISGLSFDNLTLEIIKRRFGAYGDFMDNIDLSKYLKINKSRLSALYRYLGIKNFHKNSTDVNRKNAKERGLRQYDPNTLEGQKSIERERQRALKQFNPNTQEGKRNIEENRQRAIEQFNPNTQEGRDRRDNLRKRIQILKEHNKSANKEAIDKLLKCTSIKQVKAKFKDNYYLKNVKDEKTLVNEYEQYRKKEKMGALTEEDEKSDYDKVYTYLAYVKVGEKPGITFENLALKLIKKRFAEFASMEELSDYFSTNYFEIKLLFNYLGIKNFDLRKGGLWSKRKG